MARPETIETESDWFNSLNGAVMLGFLSGRGVVLSPRKLRLLAVACCRLMWPLITDPVSRRAVEAAEGFADGLGGLEELGSVADRLSVEGVPVRSLPAEVATAVRWACRYPFEEREVFVCSWHATMAAYYHDLAAGKFPIGTVYYDHVSAGCHHASLRGHCNAVRDLFGNPFRPVSLNPVGQAEPVMALAQGIYEGRAWDRLPALADALEGAGCEDPPVLDHCRGDGPHHRGCWVVDMVLGKT